MTAWGFVLDINLSWFYRASIIMCSFWDTYILIGYKRVFYCKSDDVTINLSVILLEGGNRWYLPSLTLPPYIDINLGGLRYSSNKEFLICRWCAKFCCSIVFMENVAYWVNITVLFHQMPADYWIWQYRKVLKYVHALWLARIYSS